MSSGGTDRRKSTFQSSSRGSSSRGVVFEGVAVEGVVDIEVDTDTFVHNKYVIGWRISVVAASQ